MSGRVTIFLSDGYRVFFLGAGLFAVFSALVWEIWLGVHFLGGMVTEMPFAVAPHQWHAHEMIFGYAGAALGGFLLTVSAGGTRSPALRQSIIAMAACIWLLGRIAIWDSAALPPMLVAGLDLAFLPILIAGLTVRLARRPKAQNGMLVLFLTMIWIANLLVHLEWLGVASDTLDTGLRAGLLTLCSMIAMLGGRLAPGVTRNAMKRAGRPEATWPERSVMLDRAILALAVVLPMALLAFSPGRLVGALAVLSGLVQLARFSRWRSGWTLDKPILLSLHLGLAMLGLGLILWGLALFGLGSEAAALHLLGIGAVGGMTLAVMSRTILGQSRRNPVAPGPISAAYLLVAVGAVLRWAGSQWAGELYFPLVLASGICWILAFTFYGISIVPMLAEPRRAEAE